MPEERYNDAELAEFKTLIEAKLSAAREEVATLRDLITNFNENSEDDPPSNLEDGSDSEVREHYSDMIARQNKFIKNLENALIRISNKSYGICRVTGKLIRKERLMAVPHATLSIKAKSAPIPKPTWDEEEENGEQND